MEEEPEYSLLPMHQQPPTEIIKLQVPIMLQLQAGTSNLTIEIRWEHFSGTGMKSSPSLVNVAGHGQPIKREDTIDFSQLSDLPPFVHDISTYYHKFEKLHLIVNNGVHGTVFSVQRTSVPQLSVGQGSFGGKVSRPWQMFDNKLWRSFCL